jgi:trk system potassium uptake protein TrkA
VGLFARHLGAKKVIVRGDKMAYAPIAHKMGIDSVISPRRAVANAILRFVRRGRIASAQMLGDHEGEIIEFTVPDKPANEDIIGTPLSDLVLPENSLIGAVVRDGEAHIATGDTTLAPGDELLVVCLPGAIPAVEKLLR